MKKIKLVFLLTAAVLILSACSGTETTQDSSQTNQPSSNAPLYIDVTTGDVDWAQVQIIIDGQRGVSARLHTPDGEDFPTHVPLIPVANALGVALNIEDSHPPSVTLNGLNGAISFTVGSNSFSVGNQTVSLWHQSLLVDNEIYVPIIFFRDVFGMGQAMWMGGIVYLDVEAFDDMH